MKRHPEVYKKQENSFEDDYATLDIASTTDCTGMIPTPPLNEYEVEITLIFTLYRSKAL